MNEVEIALAGLKAPLWLDRFKRLVAEVLQVRNIHNWIVSILLCDDETMSRLNRKYRDRDGPTDVLSFAQLDDSFLIPTAKYSFAGDIVISLPTLKKNALQNAVSEEEELKRLVIHGILHLEGMDHDQKNNEMIELQENILQCFQEERLF